MQEIRTIVHLVRSYYKHTDFCVITPYDAQRAAIEAQLKSENLPWERVFNVDSFQGMCGLFVVDRRTLTYSSTGNEADYVLISVVRSSTPGFLTSLNRMNVMLTRCRAGLVIVTNRSFLQEGGRHTLLGRLARHWENVRGIDQTWVNWRLVAEEIVDLPGSLGSRRKLQAPFGHVSQNLQGFAIDMNTHAQMFWNASASLSSLARQEAEATYANVATFPRGWIAVSQQDAPFSHPNLPKTSLPRIPHNESFSVINGVSEHVYAISEKFNEVMKYEAQQQSAYESSFPSLDVPQRTPEPTTVPRRPAPQKKIGQKVPTLRKTPAARTTPKIASKPAPPPPSPSENVEIISPRVIRIISKKPQTDDTTSGQKVVENKRKGQMSRKSSSK
jgi:AAA domain